jgi:hypothetical protein
VLLVLGPGTPYGPPGLVAHFYRPAGMEVRELGLASFPRELRSSPGPALAAARDGVRLGRLAPSGVRCTEEGTGLPRLLERLPHARAEDRWILFRCEKAEAPPRPPEHAGNGLDSGKIP